MSCMSFFFLIIEVCGFTKIIIRNWNWNIWIHYFHFIFFFCKHNQKSAGFLHIVKCTFLLKKFCAFESNFRNFHLSFFLLQGWHFHGERSDISWHQIWASLSAVQHWCPSLSPGIHGDKNKCRCIHSFVFFSVHMTLTNQN